MFAELKSLFFGKASASAVASQVPVDELQLAEAALLFHVIAADGIVSQKEKDRLALVLSEKFALSYEEAVTLMAQAKQADLEAVDLFAFTRILKRELSPPEKLAIVRDLWEMVYADGEVHEFEDNIVWRVAELIDVGARDRVELKRIVREASGTPEA